MLLSVIIVTYNSGPILLKCLDGLYKSDIGDEIEVIIVDNSSTDGMLDTVNRRFPAVQIIHNHENLGFAAANNIGLRHARGQFLLLLNPDAIVRPDALRQMVSAMSQSSGVGVLGPRTFDSDGLIALTAYGPLTVANVIWNYLGLKYLLPNRGWGQYQQVCQHSLTPTDVAWVQGSCLLLRHEVFAAIGGLDEELFLFAEEPDFCERVRAAGWRVIFLPSAEVEHQESTTISRYPAVKMHHLHISPLHYFRKRNRYRAVSALKVFFLFELLLKGLMRFAQMKWLKDPVARKKLIAYWTVGREVWSF